uniref:Uncharacterized protein n=1 Tax=Tetranychus urticae TaxID=32264 RepID=T1KPK2_TETUR
MVCDFDSSIEKLPDNVLFTIINKVQFLDDLFNVFNRRWNDLGQYRLQHIKHLIGLPKDSQVTIKDRETLFFNSSPIPSSSRVKQILPNIQTILIKEKLDCDKLSTAGTAVSCCKQEEFPGRVELASDAKGLFIYDCVKLILYEPSPEIELNDPEVKYLKTFLDLIDVYGQYIESLTILTLDCQQLKILSNLLTGDNWKDLDGNYPAYPEDVTHLTIGIPVWYDFRYVTLRCPQLETLYFLARDSWNLVTHHQFDSFQHYSLRNLFLEFWANDYCHIDPWVYVKLFPKIRQLAIRDHPKLDDSSVYSHLVSLRYLDNLDVRGCPKVSPSSTEKIIWNAQCDLPHRVNYFCGPYERVNFVKINADFIFTSWKLGSVNPFDLYSMLARQLLSAGQRLT